MVAATGYCTKTMPGENFETVRRFFESIGTPRQATIDETLRETTTENVIYMEDPQWPGSATFRGREAVTKCWASYDELMGEAITASVTELRTAGDQIVATVRVAGKTRGSGVPFDHTWGYVCETKGGKISFFRAYFDRTEALEAAGLGE